MVSKALPVAEALYPGYSLFFLFDNATSHSVYAKDALQAWEMNKGIGGKQVPLCNGWFDQNGTQIDQSMSFQEENSWWTQKGIQKVLEKRNLWPTQGLNLECPKLKCSNCQLTADCKVYVKDHKCDLCKSLRQHSGSPPCSKIQKCDACAFREEHCQYVAKAYCSTCSAKKGKCADCEDLPPKYTTNGKLIASVSYILLICCLACCARCLLFAQPDFKAQKCDIKESITQSVNEKHHLVMYYPKYYCELNYIEHFWCSAKKWACKNCNYTLKDFWRCVPRALASVSNYTVLAYFHRCGLKMDLYREGIDYGSTH